MLKLDENLRKFRLKRELTQEQFANILGVSAQAVSRWENGTTYPDITLLPTIASYFEVTLDELMGMEDFKNQEQLKELREQLNENGSKGLLYENILLLRDAIKNYPTDYELQLEFISYIRFCQCKNGRALSEEEQISLYREGVEIGNRILSRCTDCKIINRTTQQLCYIYFNLGEKDKAIEYASKLPDIGACSTLILGDLYEGEQQKLHLQWAVKAYASVLWSTLRNMADLDYKDKTMSNAERISIMKKALAMFEIVFENGDYIEYSCAVSGMHTYIAELAIHENDYELALSSFEKAAEYAIMQDELPQKSQHTSLLVNKLEWDASNVIKSCDWSWCKILHDKMLLDRYDAIRNNARFIAVFGKIEKYC